MNARGHFTFVIILSLMTILTSGCQQTDSNATYAGSGSISPESACLSQLGVPVQSEPHTALVKIFQHSSDTADKTGLVETIFSGSDQPSDRVAVQVFDPSRSDTLTMASWVPETDAYEGFYHYEWFYLLGQNDEIKTANEQNVVRLDNSTYEANLAKKVKSFKGMQYSVKNCLITDLRYIQDGRELHVTFDYSLSAEAIEIIDIAWDQISGNSSNDDEIATVLQAFDDIDASPDFPSSVDGYELSYQSEVIEWRVFEEDVWWVPIEQYDNGARMSCDDEYWVVRWRSANPNVEMDSAIGLNDLGEFSGGDEIASGISGYMEGYGCLAPAIRFGIELNGTGANLSDLYAEYQLWSLDPQI
jgi:hypothetical protein